MVGLQHIVAYILKSDMKLFGTKQFNALTQIVKDLYWVNFEFPFLTLKSK